MSFFRHDGLEKKVAKLQDDISSLRNKIYESEFVKDSGFYVEHNRISRLEERLTALLEALGYEEVVIPERPKKIVMRKKGKK